nr:hypothetical protein [Pseudomonas sp. HS-2]
MYKRQACMRANSSGVGAGGMTPVSYTHLDVYKRQACMRANSSGVGAGGMTPVSYTHLDVYKRQSSPCPRS